MKDGLIGVGVVGANPTRGWAARAHLPAISALPQFQLTAVATTRAESADAAREKFGARHAFTDVDRLATHPDVDLVVVTVKVSAHVKLVTAALAAGKHVYCEWPLTRTAGEAAALADAADAAGVHTVVGLQARSSPAVVRARALITDGHLGQVLSATLYSGRGKGLALDVPGWTAYTYDRHEGAGLVEVVGGHALDLVEHLLGPARELTARTAIRTPRHRVAETGEAITVTSADQLVIAAELDSGAVVSIHLHDGEAVFPRTRLEIAGTEANLALMSAPEANPSAVQLQVGALELFESRPGRGEWQPVALEPQPAGVLATEPANVARLYGQLAADLREGTHRVPDFRTAHRLHTQLERLLR